MRSEIKSFKYFDLPAAKCKLGLGTGLNPEQNMKLSEVSSEYFCQVFTDIFST